MSARSAAVLVLVTVLAAGCAGTRGPSGYLQPAPVTQREAYGGWLTLEFEDGARIDGELIAATSDSVFVLPTAGPLRAVPRAQVHRAVLGAYDAQWGSLGVWTMVGSLATLSHGLILGLSLPVWLIAGPIATGAASRAPIVKDDHPGAWVRMAMFARFPAGLPDGLDRSALRGRVLRR